MVYLLVVFLNTQKVKELLKDKQAYNILGMIIVSQINKIIIGLRYFFRYILLIIVSFVIFSCTKEEEDTNPNRINIIGEWDCHDNKSANEIYDERDYNIDILKTDSNYIISNYASLGIDITASFNKNASNFSVELQNVDGFITHGTGIFSSDNKSATFTYYLDDEQINSRWTHK